MNVAEFIEYMKQFPQDAEVEIMTATDMDYAEWETGKETSFEPANMIRDEFTEQVEYTDYSKYKDTDWCGPGTKFYMKKVVRIGQE